MKWRLVAIAILLGGAAVVVSIRRREPIAPSQSDQARRAEDSQIVKRLPTLDGYPFEVRYSAQAREQAVRLADLAREAYEYFVTLFPASPPAFTALFLTPDDWKRGYGMPSYDPIERRLRVATNDNSLWQLQGTIARFVSPLSALPRLKRTYADASGDLQLRRFFDLLAVHELAHAFEDQGGTAFPTLWLSEIYANLALHAFVAKRRPSELAKLTTLPDVQSDIVVFATMMRATGYTSLNEFEQHYPVGTDKPMSGPNYGWYQVRFTVLAREIFEESGEAALSRLWAFGQREAVRRASSPYDYFRQHRTLGWFERRLCERSCAKARVGGQSASGPSRRGVALIRSLRVRLELGKQIRIEPERHDIPSSPRTPCVFLSLLLSYTTMTRVPNDQQRGRRPGGQQSGRR